MEIIDNKGFKIEVTDLEKAIEQADYFRHMQLFLDGNDTTFEKKQNAYWNDVYEKLKKLNRANLVA